MEKDAPWIEVEVRKKTLGRNLCEPTELTELSDPYLR